MINNEIPTRPMMAWVVTAGIDGGLFSSCNAKTMPPPTRAKNRKKAATLFNLSGRPVNISVNNTMTPDKAIPACSMARPGERLR